jgi:hypothetical protein
MRVTVETAKSARSAGERTQIRTGQMSPGKRPRRTVQIRVAIAKAAPHFKLLRAPLACTNIQQKNNGLKMACQKGKSSSFLLDRK